MQFISDITVEPIMQIGSDDMIAAAAWVSTTAQEAFQRAKENPEDVEKLIPYLIKHRHGSPFEHGMLTLYVHAPIFVWREWHRHRIGFSYNEESARYKKLDPVFYVPSIDRPMMKPDVAWKPGRPKFITLSEFYNFPDEINGVFDEMTDDMIQGYRDEYARYERQLERGLDPGLARDNLPVGIYSSCWVTCNPRSIMAFLSLRVGTDESMFRSYPLYEIDQAARRIEAIFEAHWPITHAAFVASGRVAP